MSMGFLIEDDAPVIWRGPMIMKAIQQFIRRGMGAAGLFAGGFAAGHGRRATVIVPNCPARWRRYRHHPQEASLGVVRKGIAMFEKVNVPILGIVENMSYFVTPKGERLEIFRHGGGRAKRNGAIFLFRVKYRFLQKSASAATLGFRWWSANRKGRPQRLLLRWPGPCAKARLSYVNNVSLWKYNQHRPTPPGKPRRAGRH